MVQEVNDELKYVLNAYERLEKYHSAEGNIDPDILAELRYEMEKFEDSEDDVSELERALDELQVNESDAESSASARGRLFQVVTDAVRSFATKQNMKAIAQRVGEEMYSKAGESVIQQVKGSHSSEERSVPQQSAQGHVHKHVQRDLSVTKRLQ